MKNKIYKLYRMCAKLNLYFSSHKTNCARITKELTEIKVLVEELLEEATFAFEPEDS